MLKCLIGECFQANCSKVLVQTPRKPACRSPPDCSAEPRADTDKQTGGYGSATMVLQDIECILVQARARPKTQVPVFYTAHASKPEASAIHQYHGINTCIRWPQIYCTARKMTLFIISHQTQVLAGDAMATTITIDYNS